MSFPTLKPMERRYLMVKTAVVRVLPSPKALHPFLLRNVILTDFTGMLKHALKKPLVNGDQE